MNTESQYRTQNGVAVYRYPNSALHSFCLCLYVRGGCMYEPQEQNGVTHLLEHVIFRNVNHLCHGKLYPTLDRLGLDFNAGTYKEFVRFSITGAPCHFEAAAELFCRILAPITVDAATIAVEKKRVKAEIRETDDKNSLDYFAEGFVWENTSLQRLITGTPARVDAMGKTALEQARAQLFTPENMFFYLTGNVSEQNVACLCRAVEGYRLQTGPVKANLAPVPKGFFSRDARVEVKNAREHFLRFSFDLDMSCLPDAPLNMLYDVLFCGDNCKMFQALSEQSGLVYSYDARLEKYGNLGTLSFCFEVKKQDVLAAVEKVVQVLRQIKTGLQDELDYVRATYTDNAGMLLDSAEDLNWTRGYHGHILGEFYPTEDDRIRAYAQVTPACVDELSRRVFCTKNLVLAIKTDKKALDCQAVRRLLLSLDD